MWFNRQISLIFFTSNLLLILLLSPGFLLFLDIFGSDRLSLSFENSLHQHTLVLVLVPLRPHVEIVVEGLVDLFACPISAQEPPEDALSADPHDLGGHPGFFGSFPTSQACVPALFDSFVVETGPGAGVDLDGVLDDEPIFDQLAHILSGVRQRDLLNLVGVHPHSALSALKYVGCESFLKSQSNH